MATPLDHGNTIVLVAAPSVAALFVFWPFGMAFAAGVIALIYLPLMETKDAIKSIVGSTFIGGTLAQLLAKPFMHFLASFHPPLTSWTKEVDSLFATMAILAILIGLFAQKLMPKLLARAGRVVDGGKEE